MPLVAHHNQIDLDPGEWLFEDGVLWACLPCGHLWAANHPANSVRWDVSGPPEAPTARPSVHCHGGDPRGGSCWHGWLTAGEWKEA